MLPQTPLRLIITHPGRAHRDDLYACGLLLALRPHAAVERRNPTPDELNDPEVAVLDVGGRHEPDRLNFDHHQFPVTFDPACALTLVLRWMNAEKMAHILWPWFEGLEWLDSRGPVATAKRFTPGIPARDGLLRMASPADEWMLRQFEAGNLTPVRGVGESLLNELRAVEERFQALDSHAVWTQVDGLDVLDTRKAVSGDQRPDFGVEAWYRLAGRIPAIIVAHSPRDPGATNLVRVNDHPRVDFRGLKGHPQVIWIHASGFLASAHPNDEGGLRAMINQVILPA